MADNLQLLKKKINLAITILPIINTN